MTETPLDRAHAAMMSAPEDEGARRRYFGIFFTTEFSLLLTGPAGETVNVKTIDVEGRTLGLVFDSEIRVAEFTGEGADTLKLTGGDLAELLAGTGLGVGVNLGPSGAPMELTPDHLDWILEEAPPAINDIQTDIEFVGKPEEIPPGLLEALDTRLATLQGQAEAVYLVSAASETRATLLLIVTGAKPERRSAVAGHIAAGLRFSDIESPVDITFADPGDPLLLAAAEYGLRFDVPAEVAQQIPPGSDPAKPPRLH